MNALIPAAIEGGLDAGRKASNLAFALRILPPDRRRDALIFYRFCRTLDDIADSPGLSDPERTDALAAWSEALRIPGRAPADLETVIERHGIDRTLLQELLLGIQADLTVRRYETFEDLRRYCWRVASAVGLVSIRIFGCRHPASAAYAESLGLALQMTNILRDVGEDFANGRIYLPAEDMARFGVSESDLRTRTLSPDFRALMRFEAGRAQAFFDAARQSLPAEDRKALLPAEIMREIYFRVLGKMQRDGFRVFEKRYRLGRVEKLAVIARVFMQRRRSRDDESPAAARAG